MDLKDFVMKIFPKKDEERYSKMIDNLKRLGFDSVSDLKYLDEEAIQELEAFSRIEIKRLTDHLTKFEIETLDDVLNEIFDGTPEKRIKEIKMFLNEREIYVRKDILVINVMEMRKEHFFSENEFLKIENFLEKYNNRYYEEIMRKKKIQETDLTPTLYEIFSGAGVNRISEIEEILKNQEITAEKHLVYIDIDKFKREKILSDIEVLKIENYLEENHKEQFEKIKEKKELEESNNIKYVLEKILCGTSIRRLKKIEEILKKEEIHSGKDVLMMDLNSSQLKASLSNAEMLKFEDYIQKNNLEHYEKIRREREVEQSKFEVNAKIKESRIQMEMEQKKFQLSMKQERHKSLIKEMEKLSKRVSQTCGNKPDLKKGVETYYRAFGIFPFIFYASGKKSEAPTQEPDFEKLQMVIKDDLSRINEIHCELKKIEKEMENLSDEISEDKS